VRHNHKELELKSAKKELPPCVGFYEKGAAECEGNARGTSESERAPCGWRVGCASFSAYLTQVGKVQADFIDIFEDPVLDAEGQPSFNGDGNPVTRSIGRAKQGNKAFFRFCESLGARASPDPEPPAEAGELVVRPPSTKLKRRTATKNPQIDPKLKRRRRRPPYKAVAARRARMTELFAAFADGIYEHLDPGRRPASKAEPARTGQVYVRDYADKWGYVGLYCRTPRSRDVPVALARMRPRSETLSVELPFDLARLKKTMTRKGWKKVAALRAAPVNRRGSRFKFEVEGLDREAAVELALALSLMMKAGGLDLPAIPSD